MSTTTRRWVVDVLLGSIGGFAIGAVIAVNVVIYAGIDEGYEASVRDVFDQNVLVGIVVVSVLVAAPVAGVVVARRIHRGRRAEHTS